MKKAFFVVLLALFTVNASAQLKKIEGKGIYTERDIYLDSIGKRYSNQVSFHFLNKRLQKIVITLKN